MRETFFKHDMEPGAVARRRRRAADAKALAEAYADVDRRDAGQCWVTGRFTMAGEPDRRLRREHHHLKGRNIKPEWVTVPKRIITVCAEAHQLITAGWIEVEGTDATKVIRFHWTDLCKGPRPFEIRSRRVSQE